MNRRELLGALGAGSAGLLAGCSGDGDPTEENPVGSESGMTVPAPKATLPDGWEVTTPNTESRTFANGSYKGVIDWKAVGHTKRYENADLRERIKQETFGKFTEPLVVGFATRVELDAFGGDLTEGIVSTASDVIENKAKNQFEQRLNEFGVKGVREAGTLERGDDEPTKYTKYEGKYTVDPITVENVDIPNVDKRSFILEGGELPVEGVLGVWRANSHIFVAGGVYPAKDYRRSRQWDITGGVHLTLDIEMGLSRSKYLGQVVSFSKSVRA